MQLDENLRYTEQPMAIVDKRVKRLCSKNIMSVKVALSGPAGVGARNCYAWEVPSLVWDSRLVIDQIQGWIFFKGGRMKRTIF